MAKATIFLQNFPQKAIIKVDFYQFEYTNGCKGLENLEPGMHVINYNDQTLFVNVESCLIIDSDLNFKEFNAEQAVEKAGFFLRVPELELDLNLKLHGLKTTPQTTSYLTEMINEYQESDSKIAGADYSKRIPQNDIPFTIIDFKSKKGASPQEITMNHRNTTNMLQEILEKQSVYELVQELSFSFVLLYIGENIDGFEQFKRITTLILNSTIVVPPFYTKLQLILAYFDDLFQDYNENFILDLVYNHGFYAHGQEWESLLEFLDTKFGWSLRDSCGQELGEECPVVVDLENLGVDRLQGLSLGMGDDGYEEL